MSSFSIEAITRIVVEVLKRLQKHEPGTIEIPIGVSNRHIHLTDADVEALFGKGHVLTPIKDLVQPGQYACAELVSIKGKNGTINNVRVLGPTRKETQVEISFTDSYALGVVPPVKESGELQNTPGIEIIGPAGSVKHDHGVIAALRHIHMSQEMGDKYGLKDKMIVDVEVGSDDRKTVFKNVLLRVSPKYALEMHLDTDEANACGARNNSIAKIVNIGE